uniref:Kinesin-like protein n=1 Tax=Phallusia mammillata TaxID=59560 RepID=A0A6F9DF35_9ASCI|nr:kinesin-like protein KIF12 [Phallusia mammillata]
MEEELETNADKEGTVAEDNEEKSDEEINKQSTFSLKGSRKLSAVELDADECNVNVVARIRPLNPQEIERSDKVATQFPGDGAVWVETQGKTKPFAFHAVFQPGCSQEEVFKNSGMGNLLDMAIGGYACTAFAYGQTGSGKTFTLTGPVTPEATELTQEKSLSDPESYGLIQFSFAYLMDQVAQKSQSNFTIKASYLEIYNEQVQDLLNPSSFEAAQVRWSKALGFYVDNLFIREVETLEDLMVVLEDGMKNRAVAEHNMNEHSSRSHSILTVYLDSDSTEENDLIVTKHGKVSFVDLAGSEKVKETGSTGETLIEATNINRSLLTLGNCISALSDAKKRGGHIPYRDSKLTKLLADSLGGTGVTLMIACVTPSSYNLSETLNTLRYAKRARKIKNKPVVRIDPREELILKLQREMKLLRQENHFLRNQLEFPQREKPRFPHPNTADGMKPRHDGDREPQAPYLPAIKANDSKDKSPDQRSVSDSSLYEMLQEYMVENEALRNENQNLVSRHNVNEREHRIISSENNRLSRKLEGVSR